MCLEQEASGIRLSKQAGLCLWGARAGQLCGCLNPVLLLPSIAVPFFSLTAEQWKPLNPEEKKRYDREFLLGFQFIFASMQKPEGLPQITDVVLDKVGAVLEIGVWGLGISALHHGRAGQGPICCALGPAAALVM